MSLAQLLECSARPAIPTIILSDNFAIARLGLGREQFNQLVFQTLAANLLRPLAKRRDVFTNSKRVGGVEPPLENLIDQLLDGPHVSVDRPHQRAQPRIVVTNRQRAGNFRQSSGLAGELLIENTFAREIGFQGREQVDQTPRAEGANLQHFAQRAAGQTPRILSEALTPQAIVRAVLQTKVFEPGPLRKTGQMALMNDLIAVLVANPGNDDLADLRDLFVGELLPHCLVEVAKKLPARETLANQTRREPLPQNLAQRERGQPVTKARITRDRHRVPPREQ